MVESGKCVDVLKKIGIRYCGENWNWHLSVFEIWVIQRSKRTMCSYVRKMNKMKK